MSLRLFLGVDIGTSVAKGTVIDENGEIITEGEFIRKHIYHSKDIYEHDPEMDWWNEFIFLIKTMTKTIGDKSKNINGIAITGMIPNICPVDKDDKVLHKAILYYDPRSIEIEKELDVELKTPKWQNQVLSMLLMLKGEMRNKWEKVNKIFTTHNYIIYKLTGQYILDTITALEYGNLFNNIKQNWNYDILSRYGINYNILPQNIREPSYVAGELKKNHATKLGLPANIPVVTGTTDTISSLLGSGLRRENDLLIYYGTYGCAPMLNSDIRKVIYDRKIKYPIEWLASIPRGGQQICSLAQFLLPMNNLKESLIELDNKAELSCPGSNGVIFLQNLDMLNSEESTEPKGNFLNIGMHCNINDMSRSILESFGYGLKFWFELSEIKVSSNKVFAGGGGARSKIWKQIVSDITGFKQIYFSKASRAYGSAVLAAISLDQKLLNNITKYQKDNYEEIIPNKNNLNIYSDVFREYKNYMNKLAARTY